MKAGRELTFGFERYFVHLRVDFQGSLAPPAKLVRHGQQGYVRRVAPPDPAGIHVVEIGFIAEHGGARQFRKPNALVGFNGSAREKKPTLRHEALAYDVIGCSVR